MDPMQQTTSHDEVEEQFERAGNADGLDRPDIVVVEDVDGVALADLGRRWTLVSAQDAWSDPDRLEGLIRGSRAVVVRNRTQVTGALLHAAPRLEVVARAGVGLDNIDMGAADDLGVVVVAAVGANAQSVGELALALAFALARDVVGHDRRVRGGAWDRNPGVELAGRTWGVIGLGSTGSATAQLAQAVGMSVVGYDPFLPSDVPVQASGITRVSSQAELLDRSDVVSLHLAASAQSYRMVNPAFLDAMRPGALLINVARGELIDEEALLAALDGGRLGGAGLDVRSVEPPAQGGLSVHPLVVSTPHIAGITGAAQDRVVEMIAEDVDRILAGTEALHAVGRHRLPSRVEIG